MEAPANGKPVPVALMDRFNGEPGLICRDSAMDTVMSGVSVSWKPYVPFIPSSVNAVE